MLVTDASIKPAQNRLRVRRRVIPRVDFGGHLPPIAFNNAKADRLARQKIGKPETVKDFDVQKDVCLLYTSPSPRDRG